MQDSPAGRVQLVIVVSLQMGAVVFLGALTASYNVVFLCIVAVWCFAAGMQWALGGKPGLVAAAATGLLVVSPPVAPSLTAVVFSTLLTVAGGCVQAALIAVWPPRRWRVQRDALTRAYRALAADARGVAADREASVRAAPLTSLREAFADSEATRRPLAYHGGYRLLSGSPRRWMPCAVATTGFRSCCPLPRISSTRSPTTTTPRGGTPNTRWPGWT
jgi:hypothetical protein